MTIAISDQQEFVFCFFGVLIETLRYICSTSFKTVSIAAARPMLRCDAIRHR